MGSISCVNFFPFFWIASKKQNRAAICTVVHKAIWDGVNSGGWLFPWPPPALQQDADFYGPKGCINPDTAALVLTGELAGEHRRFNITLQAALGQGRRCISAGNVRQLTKGRLHQLVHLGQFHAGHGLQQMECQFLEKAKKRLPVQIVYQLNGDKDIPLGLVRADRFQLRTAYDKPMIKQSALLSA